MWIHAGRSCGARLINGCGKSGPCESEYKQVFSYGRYSLCMDNVFTPCLEFLVNCHLVYDNQNSCGDQHLDGDSVTSFCQNWVQRRENWVCARFGETSMDSPIFTVTTSQVDSSPCPTTTIRPCIAYGVNLSQVHEDARHIYFQLIFFCRYIYFQCININSIEINNPRVWEQESNATNTMSCQDHKQMSVPLNSRLMELGPLATWKLQYIAVKEKHVILRETDSRSFSFLVQWKFSICY